jgi:hypothetical protein
LPQEHLIGPVLFPIYKFALKIAVLGYLGRWLLTWVCMVTFNSSYRAEHFRGGLIGILGSVWGPLWISAFIAISVVTIVFAVLERTHAQTGFLENWDPRRLPAVRDPNRIARSASVIELVVGVLFIVWWVDAFWSRTIFRLPAFEITFAPVWRYFFWGFLFVSAVNIALAAENLSRPYWTRLSASIRLASDCAGSILFCWLLRANVLAGITVPNVAAAKTLAITNAVNFWDSSRIFPAAVIFCVGIAAFDVYRIIRVRTTDTQFTAGVAAAVL